MKRNFDAWIQKFRESIADYGYYVDFDKVYSNVGKVKVPLNILNSLIGSKDIERAFIALVKKYPETLQCVPLLLAVRAQEIYAADADGAFLYDFREMNCGAEQYAVLCGRPGFLT